MSGSSWIRAHVCGIPIRQLCGPQGLSGAQGRLLCPQSRRQQQANLASTGTAGQGTDTLHMGRSRPTSAACCERAAIATQILVHKQLTRQNQAAAPGTHAEVCYAPHQAQATASCGRACEIRCVPFLQPRWRSRPLEKRAHALWLRLRGSAAPSSLPAAPGPARGRAQRTRRRHPRPLAFQRRWSGHLRYLKVPAAGPKENQGGCSSKRPK